MGPHQHNAALVNSGITLRAPLEPSCGLSNRLVSGGLTVSNTALAKSTDPDGAGRSGPSTNALPSVLAPSHLRSSPLVGPSLVGSTHLAASPSLVGHAAAVAAKPGALSHVVNKTLLTSTKPNGEGVGVGTSTLLEMHAKYKGHAAGHIKGRTTGVEMPKERLTSSEWQPQPFTCPCALMFVARHLIFVFTVKPISLTSTHGHAHSSDHITFRPREPLEVCSASKATAIDDSAHSSQRAANADRLDELLEPGVNRTPPEDAVRLPVVRVHPPRGVNRPDSRSGGNIDSGESEEFCNVSAATQSNTQLFI